MVLLNSTRAFLYTANFTEKTHRQLWTEAVNNTDDVKNSTTTMGSRIIVNELIFRK